MDINFMKRYVSAHSGSFSAHSGSKGDYIKLFPEFREDVRGILVVTDLPVAMAPLTNLQIATIVRLRFEGNTRDQTLRMMYFSAFFVGKEVPQGAAVPQKHEHTVSDDLQSRENIPEMCCSRSDRESAEL